ncbi:MAG: cupin domain-containing protein [Pseudomonadota bacterium]
MRPAAVVRDLADIETEGWDTPARGSICWQTLFSAGVTATDSMVCGVATLNAGEDFALHHHPEPEVYFGVEGETTVMVDGKPCRLAPGVAIFIPSGAVHGIAPVAQRVRFFYVFAAARFEDIAYTFAPPGTVLN